MKNIIKKIGFISCIILMFFAIFAPIAFGQQEDLFNTLGDIKNENPNLIDYSQQQKEWGTLSPEIIKILDGYGLKSLRDVLSESNYDQNKGNVEDLIDYLGKIPGLYAVDKDGAPLESDGHPVLNDSGNMVVNEIRFTGENEIRAIILTISKTIRNIIGGIAVLWIVISAIQMVFAQGDEGKITEQRNSITYALIGLIIILLIERVITLVYGVPGVERGIGTTTTGISTEVLGLVSFIKGIIGAIAILMIIVSGYRIITAEGDEEKIKRQKRGILWAVVGLVIIIVNKFIIDNLYIQPLKNQIGGGEAITRSNITNIINAFGTILEYLLGFVGIVAFAALIYGGASLIANYSNDEMADNAKKIIKNAIIGIIVVLSAYALVATVIKFS